MLICVDSQRASKVFMTIWGRCELQLFSVAEVKAACRWGLGNIYWNLYFNRVESLSSRPLQTSKPKGILNSRRDFNSPKMFYQGDLQSGISKAVQESKLVACFVTGEIYHLSSPPASTVGS